MVNRMNVRNGSNPEVRAGSAHHSHAKRPMVAYLLNGEYTAHRDGLGEIVHKPGEQWVEGADVAHWSENRGAEPAVLINVDVLPAEKRPATAPINEGA